MIGTITHILAKAGYKAMNGPLADERRRIAGAVSPAAYVSYDPRLLAGAGWYGYRIALKGGDRSMVERARYMLKQQYVIRDSYEYYADGIYTFGVLLRQRVKMYGIGGGAEPEPDALNFYMPDGGTITLTRNGTPTEVELEYSIDGGATWQIWEEVGNVRSLTLAAGQKMYVCNTSETSNRFSLDISNYYQFSFSGTCESGGEILSLLCKDSANGVVTQSCFFRLFRYCSTLITPPKFSATNLYVSCYYQTFQGCTSMTVAPELPATQPFAQCYYRMFDGCSSLERITLHLTDASLNQCLSNWLSGVPATGDFYCPAELTIPSGSSGIPNGWTRHDI